MEVSVSLSCLFVHEPPYQTTVVCCNTVFHCGSLHMDHRTIFHLRVGLAQAHPNYKGSQVTKSIILVKICYKLAIVYLIQGVRNIFDTVTS